MSDISFGHATHTGHVRKQNEDCYGYNVDIGLWLIADGMGGHAAGDVASQVAVEHIVESCEQGTDICTATSTAHQAVIGAGERGLGHPDMGTTAVTLQVKSGQYQVAWVGDSRAYLWNGKLLVRLTRDHSMVQDLLDGGMLSKEAVATYPFSNLLTRTIGVDNSNDVEADSVSGKFNPGEQILLCSDGLTNEVNDEDIKVIFSSPGSPQELTDHLVDMALSNGGSDNVTAIVVSNDK